MASLNIAEWSPDQVAGWMSGLGSTVARYVPMLQERGLDGTKLLTLRCDDLEYLGIHIIGHQELLLEAVEHLRNFQYECSRECVQALAVRVSGAATSLARGLRAAPDARLPTQALADLAATVRAVKPLVCWLDRWAAWSGAGVAERNAALLKLSLEAAACAQRERFADHPARTVAACAQATAATADYIIQEVLDPSILQPARVDCVSLRQGARPLGFDVVRSFCGHHQLAAIRFGSPAHASGLVHDGDEIVQVGGQCVVGWGGEAVRAACSRSARASAGELCLRLRRRGARTAPPQPQARLRLHHVAPSHHIYHQLRLPTQHILREKVEVEAARTTDGALGGGAGADGAAGGAGGGAASSSDESEPLSPPASPSHLHAHIDHTRLYGPKPARAGARRHSVCGGSPRAHRSALALHQLWAEVVAARGGAGGGSGGGGGDSSGAAGGDEPTLYRRDKAVSYSTGLELSPRPQTCLGVSLGRPALSPPAIAPAQPATAPAQPAAGGEPDRGRGRLDKSHSTPAYELDGSGIGTGAATLREQTIPESPTPAPVPAPPPAHAKADQIQDFKLYSTRLTDTLHTQTHTEMERDANTNKLFETVNIPVVDTQPRDGPHRLSTFAPEGKAFSVTDQVRTIQEEIVQVITKKQCPPVPPPRPASTRPAPRDPPREFPVLRPVPRTHSPDLKNSPIKPVRAGDPPQISLPLRHITKHDIKLIPTECREMPPLNGEADVPRTPDKDVSEPAGPNPPRPGALSPTGGVRGIFPTSKTKGLKKKNSILAKRRLVGAREVWPLGVAGAVWRRVRVRGRPAPRWARRHLLLVDNTLYAYRTPHCAKAECMIYLEGFTVCCAGEVRSRAHAFKVYHTGTAFYFAAESRDAALAWVHLLHRATLLPPQHSHQLDISNQYSETDYSETESDTENSEQKESKEKEKEKEREKEKSKFGSLKKLTQRAQRSESAENVGQAATSLDRKYLRFFSRARKDDVKLNKSKQAGVPVPTEHYRSYRRVPAAANVLGPATEYSPGPVTQSAAGPGTQPAPVPDVRRRIPSPINYIHASNPNLLDFEKSDFVTKPTLQVKKPKSTKLDRGLGVGGSASVVTLEQLMLQKQAEERRQPYCGRVHLGVQADQRHHKELAKRLERIVPDVIYGEVPRGDAHIQGRSLPPAPAPAPVTTLAPTSALPLSVKGKDGYEKIVYSDEQSPAELGYESIYGEGAGAGRGEAARDRPWRDSLRRNDKVGARGAGGAGGAGGEATRPAPQDRSVPRQAHITKDSPHSYSNNHIVH